MKYGTSVFGDEWNTLMEKARQRACITGQRTKILGMRNSERAARIMGRQYDYVITLSDDPHYKKRCARTGPNGKPCVLREGSHTVSHLSRGFDPDTFVAWFYLTKTSAPTSQETNMVHITILTRNELEKEGYKIDV